VFDLAAIAMFARSPASEMPSIENYKLLKIQVEISSWIIGSADRRDG
jgi:hypothetical protein